MSFKRKHRKGFPPLGTLLLCLGGFFHGNMSNVVTVSHILDDNDAKYAEYIDVSKWLDKW